VQWQIRIAAGEQVPFAQKDFTPRGWAIECRITSEDPSNGFLPSIGRIAHLHVPTGPGVRWDGGIDAGGEIGLHYDPMLAKLIVHAPTRPLAIARMRRALLELTIEGIETSRGFHVRVMDHPAFQSGDISIQWLEQTLDELTAPTHDPATLRLAALGAALLTHHERVNGGVGTASHSPSSPPVTDSQRADRQTWSVQARLDALRS
jgi:acetyl-CoA carboxylase, biotin carboxylase subunit